MKKIMLLILLVIIIGFLYFLFFANKGNCKLGERQSGSMIRDGEPVCCPIGAKCD